MSIDAALEGRMLALRHMITALAARLPDEKPFEPLIWAADQLEVNEGAKLTERSSAYRAEVDNVAAAALQLKKAVRK